MTASSSVSISRKRLRSPESDFFFIVTPPTKSKHNEVRVRRCQAQVTNCQKLSSRQRVDTEPALQRRHAGGLEAGASKVEHRRRSIVSTANWVGGSHPRGDVGGARSGWGQLNRVVL